MTVAFLFPGQGSQAVGMGRDLYESSPAARAIFDQANELLAFDLRQLCFEGPAETLTDTYNAQPALLTMSTALLAALAEQAGTSPLAYVSERAACVAGHSLGEYSALVAAGALSFATALQLVRRRGELMAAATEGSMAAIIGMDEAKVEAICRAVATADSPVVIANYNSADQQVISGAADAVAQVVAQAKEAGARRAIPLKVSAAFHSPLMAAAAAGLVPALQAAEFHDAQVPVIANVTAEPLRAAEAIRAELMAQVTASVRWTASVQQMLQQGVSTFVEIGPGNVLTGLVKRSAPSATLVTVNDLASVRGQA